MPTYDYVCTKCDHKWESFQSIKAEPERKCPECGKRSAKRMIGPGAGIIFRGSGFYQTDYRSDSYKKAAEKEKPATDKPATDKAGDSKKTEAKSELKSESKSKAKD